MIGDEQLRGWRVLVTSLYPLPTATPSRTVTLILVSVGCSDNKSCGAQDMAGTQQACLDTPKARAHCSLTCEQELGPAHLPQQILLPQAAGSCDPEGRCMTTYLGLGAN